MKNQALFSSKDKSKKLKCHLLQFLFGALRVKDKYSCLLGVIILLCNSPVTLLFHQRKHPILQR